jgi:hypothetical protein
MSCQEDNPERLLAIRCADLVTAHKQSRVNFLDDGAVDAHFFYGLVQRSAKEGQGESAGCQDGCQYLFHGVFLVYWFYSKLLGGFTPRREDKRRRLIGSMVNQFAPACP